VPVRRAERKFGGECRQIEIMPRRKCEFTDPVLLGVMKSTQADAPAVRGLERHASVRAAPNMSAFDRRSLASKHRTLVPPNPCAMLRAGTQHPHIASLRRQAIGQKNPRN
jgi:hypothetical protein